MTQRFDFLVFLKGRRTPISIEHNMRSGLATLDVCGKPNKSWQAKKLIDVFDVPFNFTHDGHKFTIRKQIDEDGEETESLQLDIDGIEFSKHPYITKDFVLDEEKQLVYCSGLWFNGIQVFHNSESETWSSSMLN